MYLNDKIKWWATHHRAQAKTVTWRIVASTDTFLLGYAILTLTELEAAAIAGAIATGEIITKMFLYWAHEKLWQRIPNEAT